MSLKTRLSRLEKCFGETSRNAVHWVAIVDAQLIRVGLGNGTSLTGPEAQRVLEEAEKNRDPYKVYLFDPNELFAPWFH